MPEIGAILLTFFFFIFIFSSYCGFWCLPRLVFLRGSAKSNVWSWYSYLLPSGSSEWSNVIFYDTLCARISRRYGNVSS